MNMRVLMRSTGAVTVVVARPVTMEAPKWVEKLSPMPVVLIHHCFAWSYDAHCVAVKAAALSCSRYPPLRRRRWLLQMLTLHSRVTALNKALSSL